MGPKIEKEGSKTEKTGKKTNKPYNKRKSRVTKDSTSVSEEQAEEDPGPKPPYHDLMFHPIIPRPLPARKVQTTKIPVLKKRLRGNMFLLQLKDIGSANPSAQSIANSPLSTRSQVDLSEDKSAGVRSMTLSTMESKSHTQFQTLNPTVCKPKPLPLWHPPVKGIKNVQVALQRERTGTRSYKDVQRNSLRKERLSLATFELEKQKQFQFENFLMKKTGKSRGNLLLRRQQLQPHTESTGRERPIICRELVHSPSPQKPPILNLFCEHGNPGYHRKDLTLTLTKRQRGFMVITEWLGAPHLTDTIVKLLGVDPRESIKRLGEVQKSAGFHPDRGDHFVPVIPELAVVGVPCKERFSHWNHVDTKKVGREHIKHNKPHFLDTHSKRGGRIYRTSKVERKNLRGVVSVNFGGEHLAWRGPQCESETNLADKVFVIEISCSALLGENTIGSTTISNTGTVAINYHWVQRGREHNFDLNINKMHFAFDCWGGLLLPGETHRVPAMYRAKEKGFFSEDWRLVTTPVLEAGAPIVLRLSGVTRHSITNLRRIKDLDQKIRILIGTSIVEDRVCEIVRSLSSKNLHQKDVSFADHRNGNEQFEWKNPGYYYHSAAVYRLGKLAELLETHFDLKLRLVSRDHSAIFSKKSGSSDQSPDIEVASEIMLATETGSALQSFSQLQTKLSSRMSLGTREPTIMHGTSETLVYTQASDMMNKEEAKEHEVSINDEDEFTSFPDYFYRSSFRVSASYFVQGRGAEIYQILMKCSDMDLLGMSKNREKDMKKGAKKILKEKAMLSPDKKHKQVIGGSSRESSRALKSKGSSTKSGELSGDRSGNSLRASNPSSPTVRGHRVPSRDKSGTSTRVSSTSSPRNSNLRNASTSIRNLNFSHNNSNRQLYESIDSKEGSVSSLRDRETEDRPMNSWLNVVDTDIQIDSLRSQILQDSRLEVKEAAFDVMNDALYQLSFRPVEPLENWKLVTGFTNLCSTIDAFNDFAVRLKNTCCYSQLMEAKSIDGGRIIRFASSTTKDEIDENVDKMSGTTKMTPSVFVQLVQRELDKSKSNIDGWDPSSQLTEPESGVDKIRRQGSRKIMNKNNKELTASVASRTGSSQKIPVARGDVADREQNLELDSDTIESHFLESAKGSSGSHISPTEEPYTPNHRTKTFQSTAEILETLCSKHAAKDILSHERYHDQYASGLYTEMYRLLSDYIDTMDALWSTDERAKLPNPMEKTCTFTRVKNIDRGARFEDYMYGAKTPPFIAQSIKLNSVIDANNKRAMECRAEEKNAFHQSKSYISLKAQKQRHALTENDNIKSKSNSLQM